MIQIRISRFPRVPLRIVIPGEHNYLYYSYRLSFATGSEKLSVLSAFSDQFLGPTEGWKVREFGCVDAQKMSH